MKTSTITITVITDDEDITETKVEAYGSLQEMSFGIYEACQNNPAVKAIFLGAIAGGALSVEEMMEASTVSE